jgi:hypothetical protein
MPLQAGLALLLLLLLFHGRIDDRGVVGLLDFGDLEY